MAKKGLETLKKYSTMDDLENFIHSKKIDKLVPKRKVIPTISTLISTIVILLLLFGTFLFIRFDLATKILEYKNVRNSRDMDINRLGVKEFSLENYNNNFIDFEDKSIYTFSGKQIEEFFTNASLLFQENKDNKVKTYLNLIKYSNANDDIKNKARLLESYLVEPDWAKFTDDFTFKDIAENLYQYEGCFVKWRELFQI